MFCVCVCVCVTSKSKKKKRLFRELNCQILSKQLLTKLLQID